MEPKITSSRIYVPFFFNYLKTGKEARYIEFDDDKDVKTILSETKQLLEDYKSGRKIPPCR